MHGNTKIKFVNAKQAKTYYNYKNNKRKMYRINAAIWYNKKCNNLHQAGPNKPIHFCLFKIPEPNLNLRTHF